MKQSHINPPQQFVERYGCILAQFKQKILKQQAVIQFELSTYGRDYYARHQSVPTEEDSPHFKRLITRWNLANRLLQSWGIKLWCDPSITKRNEPKCIVHVLTYLVLVIGCVDIKHLVLVGVVLTLNILCLWSVVWHKLPMERKQVYVNNFAAHLFLYWPGYLISWKVKG